MFFYCSILITVILVFSTLQAEVVLDGRLGSNLTLTGPDFVVGAELGQQQGNNLFHSFEKFSINQGESATFSGPVHIENVISRVTGGYLSYLDGTLRSTMPHADMYLINPAGILFGPHASLDLAGSLHVSTANTLRLQDGTEFSAQHPEQSTLTIAPPVAFGFLDDAPTTLRLEGTQLSLPLGKTLSLVGGEVQLEQATIHVTDGRLMMAGVAEKGEIALTHENFKVPSSMAQITLNNSQLRAEGRGSIDVHAGQLDIDNSALSVNTSGTGESRGINISADNINIINNSKLASKNLGTGQNGGININATGNISLGGDENSLSRIKTTTESAGKAGNIHIKSNQLFLKSGSAIESTTTGTGKGGDVILKVKGNIVLDATGGQPDTSGYIYSTTGHLGEGGSLKIKANQLYLTENSVVVTDTANGGQSGDVVIDVSQLHLAEGAQILSVTYGDGLGGNIVLKATDKITLTGESTDGRPSGIFSETVGAGNTGTITLKTNQLHISEGAQVSVTTYGEGQGGNIIAGVTDEIKISGRSQLADYPSGLFSESDAESVGNAGQINLSAKRLTLEKGANISTTTYSPGEGGVIKIHITGTMNLTGEGTTVASNARGDMDGAGAGGFIIIEADTLTLNEASTISASSQGKGLAGSISLSVGKILRAQKSAITTGTNQADGGDITITSPGYIYLLNGEITTSVKAQEGNGGNITLSPEFVVLENGRIVAQAIGGNGGNINIKTTGIYKFPPVLKSIIDASSKVGVSGEVNVNSPDINIEDSLFSLPDTVIDASVFLKRCGMIDADLRSSFLIIPYIGQLNSPADWSPSGLLIPVSTAHHSTKYNGTTARPAYQTFLW